MRGGYIKLFRSITANPLWLDDKFTPGQAWVDLLLLANFKTGHIRVRGNRIEVMRGQVGWSMERLAKRWQWSRTRVSRFLNELETSGQIVQQKNFVTTVLTITNYERYQRMIQQTEQQTMQQKDSRRDSRRCTNEELNKLNQPPTPLNAPDDSDLEPLSESWQAVVDELVVMGMGQPEIACRYARNRKCLAIEARNAIEHFKAHPGAWGIGLLYRIIEHLRPDSRISWPTPSPEYEKAKTREVVAKKQAKSSAETKSNAKLRQVEADNRKALDEKFGAELDAKSRDEISAIVTERYPHLRSMLPKSGPTTGVLRNTLLAELDSAAKQPLLCSEVQSC